MIKDLLGIKDIWLQIEYLKIRVADLEKSTAIVTVNASGSGYNTLAEVVAKHSSPKVKHASKSVRRSRKPAVKTTGDGTSI